jgi:hypothetical protein
LLIYFFPLRASRHKFPNVLRSQTIELFKFGSRVEQVLRCLVPFFDRSLHSGIELSKPLRSQTIMFLELRSEDVVSQTLWRLGRPRRVRPFLRGYVGNVR